MTNMHLRQTDNSSYNNLASLVVQSNSAIGHTVASGASQSISQKIIPVK